MTTATQDAHRYAREGNASLLRMALTENPTLVLALDSDSRTPLQACLSALPPNPQCVEACLEAFNNVPDGGFGEPNRTKCLENGDGIGNTALISAATTGIFEIVAALIGAGAQVSAQNSKGATALHYAASKGHVNVGRLLISKGADINARDKANQLALHRAASTGSLPFIHLILGSLAPTKPEKPRLNLLDRAGNTPLHLAVESGHAECAVALIEGGADRDRTDSEGTRAEEIEGVGGTEAKKVRAYIVSKVGPLDQ
ncbi:uncharacterized protein JCM15063_002961 [Sporobolomyces koalae]|uniref:uncharacterized protein n=1 Tax=Sporobolomyces koalae TaxID=500713 RepID=UPI00317B8C64